jgi:hypothetical protein
MFWGWFHLFHFSGVLPEFTLSSKKFQLFSLQKIISHGRYSVSHITIYLKFRGIIKMQVTRTMKSKNIIKFYSRNNAFILLKKLTVKEEQFNEMAMTEYLFLNVLAEKITEDYKLIDDID